MSTLCAIHLRLHDPHGHPENLIDRAEKLGVQLVTYNDDIYPEGHQTGVTVIQHGVRVAANGDLRLETSPGQWSPVPAGGERVVDGETQTISQVLSYPDPDKDRTGFNPIVYPDLEFAYTATVKAEDGNRFRVTVDLDEALLKGMLGALLQDLPADQTLRILEVGAGTGGTSASSSSSSRRLAARKKFTVSSGSRPT